MTDWTETRWHRRLGWLTLSWVKTMLGLLTLVMLVLFTWQTVAVIQKYRQTLWFSGQQAMQKTHLIAESISTAMSGLEAVADRLAHKVADETLDPQGIEAALQQAVFNHPGVYTLGVAFDLYEVNSGLRLYAPLIQYDGSWYRGDRVDRYYDYVDTADRQAAGVAGEDWFLQAQQGKTGWLPPYYDRVHEQYIVKYVLPVKSADRQRQSRRVVFLDIALGWIRQQVEAHDLGNDSYAIIVNELGQVMYHSLQGSQQTADGLAQPLAAADLASFRTGNWGKNALTGRRAWLHSARIDTPSWSVMTVMNIIRQDMHLFSASARPQLIDKSDWIAWIVSSVVFLLLVYLWWVVAQEQFRVRQFWRHSVVVSWLFIAGIIGVWICEFRFLRRDTSDELVLPNRAAVAQFQKEYAMASLQQHKQPPLYIPAGLFVQSVEFLHAFNVAVTGYIWLRYPKSHATAMQQGVLFAEAIETTLTESYQHEQGPDIIKGWRFRVILREFFDYSVFPFDHQSVWIRLWPQDFGSNIILIPDFAAYDSLNPSALPGMERDFVLSGWTLLQTFYSMRMKIYNTNFGKGAFRHRDNMPELYFHIELSRNFIDPLISHFFPLLVVLFMLFAIVFTITRHEQRRDLFGFNASAVIASCAALFFVVLIAHVQLRNALASSGIVYLEYFYLVSYVMLLMAMLDALLLSKDAPVSIVDIQDNLIPKITYWPFLSGCLFVCTAAVFWGP